MKVQVLNVFVLLQAPCPLAFIFMIYSQLFQIPTGLRLVISNTEEYRFRGSVFVWSIILTRTKMELRSKMMLILKRKQVEITVLHTHPGQHLHKDAARQAHTETEKQAELLSSYRHSVSGHSV